MENNPLSSKDRRQQTKQQTPALKEGARQKKRHDVFDPPREEAEKIRKKARKYYKEDIFHTHHEKILATIQYPGWEGFGYVELPKNPPYVTNFEGDFIHVVLEPGKYSTKEDFYFTTQEHYDLYWGKTSHEIRQTERVKKRFYFESEHMKHKRGQSFGIGLQMGYGESINLAEESVLSFGKKRQVEKEDRNLARQQLATTTLEQRLADDQYALNPAEKVV